jgi:tetratricopeptide (TPR) repeat protein
MVIYPKWKVDASSWISYVPGTILLGSLVLFWSKRKSWGRPILFGLLYFVVMLFPVLGFFEQGLYRCSLVADHWQYYSIIGIIALTTAAGEETSHRIGRLGPKVGVLAGAAILMMLAIAAWTRACIYRHDSTLWQDNLAKNPNAWLAHNNLGHALVNEGDFAGATWHYEQALRLEPDYADAHNNLGNILLRSGKVEEAIGHFERAVQIEPDWAVAHNSLGSALLQEGKVQEAVDHLERAVRSDPNYAEAHYNLGNALLQQGKYQEAIECYRRALALKPEFAQAHHNLAVLLEADRPQEAIAHYEEAVRLYPGYTQAHYNLAMLLANQGRIDEAISHLQTALKLEPESEKIRRALDEMGSGKSGRGFLR